MKFDCRDMKRHSLTLTEANVYFRRRKVKEMKKYFKKLSICLVALMLFGMFGCNSQRQSTPSQTMYEPQTQMQTAIPTEEPTPAPFFTVTEDELRIDDGQFVLVNYAHLYSYTNETETEPITENEYLLTDRDDIELPSRITQVLTELSKAFYEHCGDRLYVTSGYRTEQYQQQLYDNYVIDHGEEMAKIYVALPGASEHHTGFAVDLSTVDGDLQRTPLEYHPDREWFAEICSDYGFILRYPIGSEQITHVAYEPWHFRYLGIPVAHAVTALGITYEEFIEQIKQYSPQTGMLFVKDADIEFDRENGYIDVAYYDEIERTVSLTDGYVIYFVPEQQQIMIPSIITDYIVSGTNDGGFIVVGKV